jgi:hypothetical protein
MFVLDEVHEQDRVIDHDELLCVWKVRPKLTDTMMIGEREWYRRQAGFDHADDILAECHIE